ncbi:unnamed protein product, partial [Scytosiphon promiscuus]
LNYSSTQNTRRRKNLLSRSAQANKKRAEAQDAYMHMEAEEQQPDDFLQVLVDAREYDVPYYGRCSIYLDIRSVSARPDHILHLRHRS